MTCTSTTSFASPKRPFALHHNSSLTGPLAVASSLENSYTISSSSLKPCRVLPEHAVAIWSDEKPTSVPTPVCA